MDRILRARRVGEVLDAHVPAPDIPLRHEDPYTLLVSVVLSAQCTDAKVNEIAPRLFARARTPRAVADLDVAEIRAIIRPCGLSEAKSRYIRELSRRIAEEHGGRVPADAEALESLPGVGHKSASVVLSQAFGIPAFPVDTHIFRCARRWGLSSGDTVGRVEADLKALFRREDWGRRHLQIIFFAREFCPAKRHVPANCPICSWADPEGERGRALPRRAKPARPARGD